MTDRKTFHYMKGIENMSYYEEKVLKLIDENSDHFISPEFSGLWGDDYDFKKILRACYSLVDKGFLKKRNCDGVAFERV